MEWLILSLSNESSGKTRPSVTPVLSCMAGTEHLHDVMWWKAGIEGSQETPGWCSGVKQGISVYLYQRVSLPGLGAAPHAMRAHCAGPAGMYLQGRGILAFMAACCTDEESSGLQDGEGPGCGQCLYSTVPLQCLYSSICIMESCYRARCKRAVFGKRLSSPLMH